MLSTLEAPILVEAPVLVSPPPVWPRAFWQLEPELVWHPSGDGHTMHVHNCSLRTVARYRKPLNTFCQGPILDGYTTTAHGDPEDVERLCRLANSFDFQRISDRLFELPFTVRLKSRTVRYETRCGTCGDHIWLSPVPAQPARIFCHRCHDLVSVF